MERLGSWFRDLGEKTGRTDLWVIVILFTVIMCHVPLFSMSIGVLEYKSDLFSELMSLLKWLLTGIFVDFGIYSWKVIEIFKRSNKNG